ncbi:MAG TPA: hypothetical protein VH186_39215 [Chloroflexia bacterium]|nr:hypothetical protein [Chloroflexia bacterium]
MVPLKLKPRRSIWRVINLVAVVSAGFLVVLALVTVIVEDDGSKSGEGLKDKQTPGLAASGPVSSPYAAITEAYFATLSARQVAELYLKAYREEDYATCKKLFAPSVVWSSPDAFDLKAHSYRKERGPIQSFEIVKETDLGSVFDFYSSVVYADPGPDANGNDSAAPAFPVTEKPGEAKWLKLEVRRVKEAWKLTYADYF